MFYSHVYLYGEKTIFSLFPDGHFQVELHSDGNSALPAADDIQFQCHVCQRVYGSRHEDRQLAECWATGLCWGILSVASLPSCWVAGEYI